MKLCSTFFLTATLALFLIACSTDNDLTAMPELGPQFGSADDDIGVDVATRSTGRIYSLSQQRGPTYEHSEGGSYENGFYVDVLLRRYNGSGTLSYTKVAADYFCSYDQYEDCGTFNARALEVDAQGSVYIMFSNSEVYGDCLSIGNTYVRKFDAAGNWVNSYFLGSVVDGSDGSAFGPADFTVDGVGNIYAAAENDIYNVTRCESDQVYKITKYANAGNTLWQRTSTVGIPYSITVSSTGSVYVVGSRGLARYSSTGNLVWTKTGTSYIGSDLSKLVASGSNLYVSVPKTKTIRKYDANGKLLWSKVQSGLNTLVIGDISADANGNVYLSGKYRPTSSSPANAFVRKLRPTGAILWTKTFGTPQYDDARAIATINGSEIYVTGETQGSLAHTNIGGSDGYLRKLNSLGNQVWIR